MASRTLSIRVEGDEEHLRILDHLLKCQQRYEGVRDAVLTDLVNDAQVTVHIVPGSYNVPDPGSQKWITLSDVANAADRLELSSNGVNRGFRALVRAIAAIKEATPIDPTEIERLLIDSVARWDNNLYMISEDSLARIFQAPGSKAYLIKQVFNFGPNTYRCIRMVLNDRGYQIP